jgi:hypothetical protein
MSLDTETGEIIENCCFESVNFENNVNLETGEYYGDDELEEPCVSAGRKIKFHVPKSYLKSSEPKRRRKKKCYLAAKESCSLSTRRQQISLKEVWVDEFPIESSLSLIHSFRKSF